jgi:hypothetical protein
MHHRKVPKTFRKVIHSSACRVPENYSKHVFFMLSSLQRSSEWVSAPDSVSPVNQKLSGFVRWRRWKPKQG